MKTKWFGVALAVFGGLAAVSVANPANAQQQLATRDNSANIGAEYKVMVEYLTKFTEAMQGSNDKESTVTNLTALPEKTGVDLKGTEKEEEAAPATRSLLVKRGGEGREGFGGAGFLSWLFSKDFNIENPFEVPLKRERIERSRLEPSKEDEVDALDAQVNSPQFTYIIGLSKAVDDAFLPRERPIEVKGQEKEAAGFGAFAFPTDNEKKD